MSQSIGFIGLGSMRQPMERTLLKADYRVTVYNRSESRARENTCHAQVALLVNGGMK